MLSSSFSFRYPESWITPVHPAHDEVRRRTEDWLREIGVLEGERAQRIFDAMNVGVYGGAPFSFAHRPALETITSYLTLWIYYDDMVEGFGEDAPHRLEEAMHGALSLRSASLSSNRHLRGWQELGRRLQATMSEGWVDRHAAEFSRWVHSVEGELALVAEAREVGRPPAFEAYIAHRIINIGVKPTVCLIEYALGRELPDAALDDRDRTRIEDLAARIVTFQNDLAGLDKDLAEGWPNAISCLSADTGLAIEDAIRRITSIHDRDVVDLARLTSRLVRTHGEGVRAWAEAITQMVAGFGHWHTSTPRYQTTLPSGELASMSIAVRGPNSMRCPPSSARLRSDKMPLSATPSTQRFRGDGAPGSTRLRVDAAPISSSIV